MNHCWKLSIAAAAAVLAGGMLGVSPGHAASITINFSGTVSSVGAGVASDFSVGDPLTGSLTYESTTAPVGGGTSTTAVFNALTAMSFTIGGYAASGAGGPDVQMGNQDGAAELTDRFAALSRASDGLTGADVNGLPLFAFGIRLDDTSGAVFSDALVLPTSLDLADFDISNFFLFFDGFNQPVSGSLTSLSVVGVPEPAMLALFGAGVLGAGLLSRRRQRL